MCLLDERWCSLNLPSSSANTISGGKLVAVAPSWRWIFLRCSLRTGHCAAALGGLVTFRCKVVAATDASEEKDQGQGRDYTLFCVCELLEMSLQLMLPSGEPAAAQEFWSGLTTDGYVAVWYDDDNVSRRRLLLTPARPGRYAVLTFVGDVNVGGVWSLLPILSVAQCPC